MRKSSERRFMRRVMASGLILGACLFQLSGACEWAALRFDPCGTIFANCEPGSFRLGFVDGIPDYSVDPTCTIPGQCGEAGAPFDSPFDDFGSGFDP